MSCVLRVALRNDACRIRAFVGVTTTPEVAEVYRRMTLYATFVRVAAYGRVTNKLIQPHVTSRRNPISHTESLFYRRRIRFECGDLCVLFIDELIEALDRSEGNTLPVHRIDRPISVTQTKCPEKILRHRSHLPPLVAVACPDTHRHRHQLSQNGSR